MIDQLNITSNASISRRNFIGQAGGFSCVVLAGSLLPKFVSAGSPEEVNREQKITAWVQLTPEGKVIIYNPAAEMGQGSMTALPIIIAEELDARWEDVIIENAPVIPEVYGLDWGEKLGGPMMTVGSRTIRGYYSALRQCGAQARWVLLYNVAAHWKVPQAELSTNAGKVIHKASGRSMDYGKVAAFATLPAAIPEIPAKDLKAEKDFKLIGHIQHRRDVPAKLNGSAQYGLDIQVPGMLYGVISRSPVFGSKPTLVNEAAIKAMPGVEQVVPLDHGIGIIAKTFVAALAAKKAMQINWSDAKATGYDSEAAYADYEKLVQDDQPAGKEIEKQGDATAAMKTANKTFDISYLADYLCHVQMEPLNAVVHIAPDGQSAEGWAGTQHADGCRDAIAKIGGVKPERVSFHPCYLGGGFGRRKLDFCEEAAHLANAIRKPVKLVWTREDDIQYGAFRPTCLQRMTAGVDSEGKLVAWQHRIAGPDERLQTGGVPMDYYLIPNQYVDLRLVDHGVRTEYWRAVGHGANKFAQEAFIGEIAYALGIDGYEYRRRMMSNLPRHLAILDAVKKMSGWGKPLPDGRSKGIAFSDYGGSYIAGVVEISLNRQAGKIRVHKVWLAADAGVVIQPDNAKAQMEGGVVMGISSVLMESIRFKDGMVQQHNFYDYPILRMNEAPEDIEVTLLPSTEAPTSMGELSLPLMGGAIANAFQLLTDKALRHIPFTPEKVLKVLEG